MRKSLQRRLRYCFYSLILCVLFFGLLEIGARLLLQQRGIEVGTYRYGVAVADVLWAHPSWRLGWTGKPHWHGEIYDTHVTLNSRGHRAGEIVPRSDRELRILLLGDSRIFGYALEANETISASTQATLAQLLPGQTVEVYNAGIPGHSSYQGRCVASSLLNDYRPDVAVFLYGFNDLRRANLAPDSPAMMAVTGVMGWINEFLRPMVRHSGFFTWAFYREGHVDVTQAWGKPRVAADAYWQNVASFIRAAADANALPVVLSVPFNPRLRREMNAADSLLDRGEAQTAFAGYLKASDAIAALLIRRHGARRLAETKHPDFSRQLLTAPVVPLAALHGGLLVSGEEPYRELELPVDIMTKGVLLLLENELADERYYLDLGHLTAEGCRRVADSLAHTIAQRFGPPDHGE